MNGTRAETAHGVVKNAATRHRGEGDNTPNQTAGMLVNPDKHPHVKDRARSAVHLLLVSPWQKASPTTRSRQQLFLPEATGRVKEFAFGEWRRVVG